MRIKELFNQKNSNPESIVIGMSGGVDSTVAAFLLKKQGYDVHGLFLRLWKAGEKQSETSREQEKLAEESADQIGISLQVIDAQSLFRERVVEYFIREYERGNTPNPCFFCNRSLKFEVLLDYADQHQIQWVSSGHYARLLQREKRVHLLRGKDSNKDQSYMLASLTSGQLERLKLPLGELTKDEVRAIAFENHFRVSVSKESQDICFLPEGDYAAFLREQTAVVDKPGEIVNLQGELIGQHQGLAFYTIGQRKGLGIFAPEPSYVVRKDLKENRLVVGKKSDLRQHSMRVHSVQWYDKRTDEPIVCDVEVRYRAVPAKAIVTPLEGGLALVAFDSPLQHIAPGQAAVFYHADEVIGSGIIEAYR